jgi:hypothetical protein
VIKVHNDLYEKYGIHTIKIVLSQDVFDLKKCEIRVESKQSLMEAYFLAGKIARGCNLQHKQEGLSICFYLLSDLICVLLFVINSFFLLVDFAKVCVKYFHFFDTFFDIGYTYSTPAFRNLYPFVINRFNAISVVTGLRNTREICQTQFGPWRFRILHDC